MDPNETLRLMRDALAEGDLETVAEMAEALDGWISTGGFLPDAWRYMPTGRELTQDEVDALGLSPYGPGEGPWREALKYVTLRVELTAPAGDQQSQLDQVVNAVNSVAYVSDVAAAQEI
jgi:hypothetical protein